ncbi:hypothetical protein [Flavobacterium covae]
MGQENNFNFNDLSYSGIVNEIDRDEQRAKSFIIEAFNKIEAQKEEVENLAKQLTVEESHLRSLENSIDFVFRHLKWHKPMIFIVNKGESNEIIVVTEDNVTLEKNVI